MITLVNPLQFLYLEMEIIYMTIFHFELVQTRVFLNIALIPSFSSFVAGFQS